MPLTPIKDIRRQELLKAAFEITKRHGLAAASVSRIAEEAKDRDVELEVHPENDEQEKVLLSQQFRNLLGNAPLGRFELLANDIAAA